MDLAGIKSVLTDLGIFRFKESTGNLILSCPFAKWNHKSGVDRNPSFAIKLDDKNPWQCFSCHVKGVGIEWIVKLYEQKSGKKQTTDSSLISKFRRVPEYSTKKIIEFDDGWYETSGKVFELKHYDDFLKFVPQYVLDRGVTLEQVKKWQIGFDRFENKLFVPIFDITGTMVGWSKRSIFSGSGPKYFHSPGMKRGKILYGEHLVNIDLENKGSKNAVVVEGFFDVWKLDLAGIKNPLGILSSKASEDQINKLCNLFNRIFVIPDNDGSGFSGANYLASELKKRGKNVVLMQPISGKKDVGDWTVQEVLDKFHDWWHQWTSKAPKV